MSVPTSITAQFKRRQIDDILETTTQAELAGRAADSVREDCFKQHVANVHEACAWSGANDYAAKGEAEAYFKSLWEREQARILAAYFRNKSRDSLTPNEKKQFNSYSNPFRSMKSVIVSAVMAGIPLVDPEGYPLGKTYLQGEIKEDKSPIQKMMETIKKVEGLLDKIGDDTVTMTTVSREIERVLRKAESKIRQAA